jgi:hypothetical protein
MISYRNYTLYKIRENKDCEIFLNIVRYLYSKGFDFRPNRIFERWSNDNIKIIPTIEFTNMNYISGIKNICIFLENMLNIDNLIKNGEKFAKLNPYYRISDQSTHKNLKKID